MAEFQRRLRRLRRFEPIERIFRDRSNPLEVLSREDVRDRYRFYPESILLMLNSMAEALDTDTNRSQPLPPLLMFLVTLSFYATGAHYLIIGDLHGVSRSSVCRAVKRTTTVLCMKLNEYVQFPSDEEVLDVKRGFFSIAGFPNVTGCIDCTQIRILAPSQNEHEYVNRKGFHSINVQMVCDPYFNIRNVVAKWPGSVHDSRVFRESMLCTYSQNGIDGHLIGDSGYACRRYLLTPYLRPSTPSQERYNNALVKTRVLIEQTFGVIKRRFPCLQYGLRLHPHRACNTIIACVVLHNFGQRRGDSFPRETIIDPQFDDIQPPYNAAVGNDAITGNNYRNFIVASYFN